MSGYEIRAETELPGTPDRVWDAIATGPGITSWCMPERFEGEGEGSDRLRPRRGVRRARRARVAVMDRAALAAG